MEIWPKGYSHNNWHVYIEKTWKTLQIFTYLGSGVCICTQSLWGATVSLVFTSNALNFGYQFESRLSQNITASEMEGYCVEKNVELFHIRKILKSEAHLKAFPCVFEFDEERVELLDFWRDWLKKMDQIWLLVIPPLIQRLTKQRSTEQKICLHNVRFVRNKTRDLNDLLEENSWKKKFWEYL